MSRFHIMFSGQSHRVVVSYSSEHDATVCPFLVSLSPDAFLHTLAQIEHLHEDWTYEEGTRPGNMPVGEKPYLHLAEDPDLYFSPNDPDEQELDDEARQLLDEIHVRLLQLRRRGISLRTIRQKLIEQQQLSRLVVTPDYRILLPDFGHLEVQLTPLPKALYLLFLRHPEGIAFKQMVDHRDELSSLYTQLAPTINPRRREQHIDAIVDPMKNSLNEKVSLIHHAFALLLDSSLLPYYVISGAKGSPRSIKLDKTLIDVS